MAANGRAATCEPPSVAEDGRRREMVSGSPPSDSGQAALARGATIGRYVILGLVGRGGMGEVYAAYDPELDRKVAVKLLRVKPGAGVSLAEGRQRTLREAQAIADRKSTRLNSSHLGISYAVFC